MEFLLNHSQELIIKLIQQIYLVSIGVIIAILIGIPLGILAARNRRIHIYILSFSGILQTIPSLALLAFLLPFLGIGAKPAIIALALYALLPVVQNTITGLTNISTDCLEAADSIGFTPHQRLWLIELPLALPFIIAGIRTATIISIGIATLAAFIGAIPAAILALSLDYLIRKIEFNLRRRSAPPKKRQWLAASIIIIILLAFLSIYLTNFSQPTNNTIKIASKNLTEQLIIGAPTEFVQRPDGMPGLTQVYGLHFKTIDDKKLFPPYDCVPIIRLSILQAHPELNQVLALLANNIDTKTMQEMNYEVDLQKRSIRQVAHEFLVKKGLI